MRLGTALFLAYLFIFGLCLAYPMAHLANRLRTRYLEGVEEPLVDQANVLAGLIGRDMETGRFDADELRQTFDAIYGRKIAARIYDLEKTRVDVRVYITDLAGTVIFDTEKPGSVGEDYSEWNDVRFTLDGGYGARTTPIDPEDPTTSILYVAAPIQINGTLAGVLTVAKPTTSINAFLAAAKPDILRIALIATLAAIALSFLVSMWVSRQIRRLTRYADDVRLGRRVALPSLARTELKQMGDAFDKMREALEGRKYVEQYVQTLTHEIKSPVSAIRGAAELLDEEMPPARRDQFLANIRHEASRIENLVERMLILSELEMKKSLDPAAKLQPTELIRRVLEDKQPSIALKQLAVTTDLDEQLSVTGDAFLLQQAISNLVQNAIDFSPPGGRIRLRARRDGPDVVLGVEDEGPGIPDYARDKVFEKFYSLKRPDTGRKSTGLGLNFVHEVATLHHGVVRLENLPTAGLRALILLPLAGRGR